MTNFLSGKKALVTGASKGIGLEIARAFLREGAHVLLCGRTQNRLDEALAEFKQQTAASKVAAHAADVSDSAQVKTLFEFADRKLGGLDILVNNAGVGIFRPMGDLTVEEWNSVIATNLSGAFYCSREAIARFKTSGAGGWIINVSSLAAKNPFAGGSAYNASKFGLNGFSEAAMLDHRSDNVRVTSIMPGSVDTEFSGQAIKKKSQWKIAPEDVAQIALDILRMPERTLISRVEVRPSRPSKD